MRLRAVLMTFALVLAVAACGDDPPITGGEDATPSTTEGGSVSSVTPPPADQSPTSTEPGSPSTTAGPGAPTSTAPPPTTIDSPPPAPGSPGDFAGFYLRAAESASILVSVHVQDGAAPRAGTIAHLKSVLEEVSGKTVTVDERPLGSDRREWSSDDIRSAASQVAPSQSRDRAVLTILFLEGDYVRPGDDSADQVVGIAVRSDIAAIFDDRVDQAAGLLGNPGPIEDAVTMHEVGHLLGLVDLFLQTGRADPDHPHHSSNPNSVMYYAVESTLVGSILGGGPPTNFDADDLADLATIRNG